MASWEAFAPWVQIPTSGCPEPVVKRALCDAAIEFCEFTHAFVEHHTLSAQIGQSQYDIDTDAGSSSMIIGVSLADRNLSPVYTEALYSVYGEIWRAHTGTPYHYLSDDENSLQVYPIPIADETGTLTLAVRPNRSSTEWDDRLFERYGEIVADGALARLLAQPGTPWADVNESLRRRVLFTRGMNRVRAKVLTSFTPATLNAGV